MPDWSYLPLAFLNFLQSLLEISHAPIRSVAPVDALYPLCANDWPRTQRDHNLCQLVERNVRCDVAYSTWFDITQELCGSSHDSDLGLPFYQAYSANGTTWQDVKITGTWQSVRKTLECLLDRVDVTAQIENIDIQIDIPMLREAQLFEETYRRLLPILHPEKVSSTTELLVKTLNGLPKLRWFGLTIPFESRAKFDEAVHKLNATDLPISARATSLGPFTQGILRHMLYVNDVAMYHWAFMYKINAQMAFIQAIVGLPLEGVQFWVDSDLKSNLEAVMNGIPSLKRLSLLGGGNGDIMTYISHLKTYSNLVELALPSAGDLDPYFDPPDCGTPYLDHPELYDIVHAEREASESRLLRIVEEHLPFLRSVSFGGNRYNLTHSNNTGSNSLNQT